MAGVLDGQDVSALVTDAAFLYKNADDQMAYQLDFTGSTGSWGSSVINIQKNINAAFSFMGGSTNQVYNYKPTWATNNRGLSTDSLFLRAEALDLAFNASTGHAHSGSAGDGAPISAANLTGTLPIAHGGTNSVAALSNNRVMQSSGGAIVEASAITAARALISDANGIPTQSSVTSTELGYVSGVTSALQTQLDAISSGLVYKKAVDYATTAALAAVTYANGSSGVGATLTEVGLGALSIDGATPAVGKRILVKNQASTLQNGIYTVTVAGSAGVAFVLTRATDFDQSAEMDQGSTVLVLLGTSNADTMWCLTSTIPVAVGTDAITFVQVAGPGSVTAGTGITVTGNQVALTSPVTVALGGTGLSSTSQNFFFAGPTSGSGAPTWRAMVTGDLPANITATGYLSLTKADINGIATQNALANTQSFARLTSGGTPVTTINGIAAGVSGQVIMIYNATGSSVTIANESGSATAANRITTTDGNSITLANLSPASFIYDAGSSRWVVSGGGGGGAVTAGTDGQLLKSMNSATIQSSYYDAWHNSIGNAFAETNTNGAATYSDAQTATMTIASPAVVTITSTTGWYVGMPLCFTNSGGALPTGVTSGTVYYISSIVSGTTFQFSATLGGTAVNTSGSQSGTHTARPFVPITGTGGSVSGLTLSRNTTTPLRGTSDFKLAQTNSTVVAGQGLSWAFTLDAADEAQPISVRFDFNASSTFVAANGQIGTIGASGVDSDLEVWVYDVTNSLLIPVSPRVITANGSNNFTFNGLFQSASNSTSYRLCLHSATSNANATGWSFRLTNLYVGRQLLSYGAPEQDWKSDLSWTWTGLGTVTANNVWYKRVGDTMFVRGAVTSGTSTGVALKVSLPTGYTIDSSKISSTTSDQLLGSGLRTAGSGKNIYADIGIGFVPFYDGSDTSAIYWATTTGNVANTLDKALANAQIASGNKLIFNFAVPILGWSSNILMSNDTDTRVVAAILTGDPASATSGNPIIVPTVTYDTHGAYNNSTGRYTVPVSGVYNLFGSCQSASSATTLTIYKNAVSYALAGNLDSNGEATFAGSVLCVAGDVIDVRPGGTVDATNFVLNVQRVSGPSAIAVTESVSAKYYASANGTASTTQMLNCDTKVYDSHGAVTSAGTGNSNWKFTAPISGKYEINAILANNGAPAGNVVFTIYKNAAVAECIGDSGTTSGLYGKNMSAVIRLVAGDFIDIRAQGNNYPWLGGTYASSSTITTLSVDRVGNY